MFFSFIVCELVESKVLQYHGDMRHNSTTLEAFAGVKKVTNYTELWDTKFTWYSLSATHQICHMA